MGRSKMAPLSLAEFLPCIYSDNYGLNKYYLLYFCYATAKLLRWSSLNSTQPASTLKGIEQLSNITIKHTDIAIFLRCDKVTAVDCSMSKISWELRAQREQLWTVCELRKSRQKLQLEL